MATYTPSLHDNLGFLSSLQSVKPHSLDAVQSVWQSIVTEWFPGRHGYRPIFKGSTLANNTMPEVTIQVWALAQNPSASQEWIERQILLVKCKCPSSNTPSCWDDTIGQFEDEIAKASDRLFGAVGIGKEVRFYEFDGRKPPGQRLAQLHGGSFDMGNRNGITQVENMMNYIKANA
ncbi:hypothetical protein N7519_008502 [Penicillium mononematosum]|uniref:uncharacterized protein n=1 Tax=Penicillium mononematosum TaxID=268346 RepID=UPI002549559B|nr:uncharacterized protein N7519_008502 [Penicillium mononematosum]KAJ6178041.1 hypothetical protein N7519_008502 [Penicillium mononematosum]